MKKIITILLLVFSSFQIYSQFLKGTVLDNDSTKAKSFDDQNDSLWRNFKREIVQPYIAGNNVQKEQVYIHFNKSCYLPGGEIWFTAYVINPTTGLLNPYTRNLYVELYNEKGKLTGHKILNVNNGTANNMLKIDYKEQPGRYVFRAYTNWMKNFYSMEEFDRPLEVLGKSIAEDSIKEDIKYDVQFFPESGTLLSGTLNKVAIKAIDPNGKSVSLNGVIFDEKNDSIASFNLSNMGMGQVVLTPENNSVYKAKVFLPGGKEETVPLPKVESSGVVASLNLFCGNRIMAEVRSNSETINEEKTFYILVHANGNVYQTHTTRLTPEKTSVIFSLDRQSVGNGVNYLTVFDENFHPVSERLFYNYKKDIRGKIEIKPFSAKDSIELCIKILNDSVKHNLSRLSISVLPGGTVSNRFTCSLLSDVLLRSGIRGKIENPQYYLEKQDNEHRIAMDLLMMTQGWRKYDWNENITNKKAIYDFEKGFSVVGKVKNWHEGKEDKSGMVSLLSPENNLFRLLKVDSVGHFSFPNLYLKDSSRVIVSASSAKGKPWNCTISVEPNNHIDSTVKVKPFVYFANKSQDKDGPPLKLLSGVIQLPEVTVSAQKTKPFDQNMLVSTFDKSVEITKDSYLKYPTLETLLRREFNLRIMVDIEGNYEIKMAKGTSPKLYIDGVEIPDFNVLSMYTVDLIEAVSGNSSGDGAIVIKTRTTSIDGNTATPTNLKSIKIRGFSSHVEYYTPKYFQTPEAESYQKYASIYWKPDLVIDSTGVNSFKFKVLEQIKNYYVRVEGISDDGTVYLKELKIKRDN